MSGPEDTSGISPVPRIIHMMHFPWDKQQRLLEDPEQFDKSTFHTMQNYAQGFEVMLWTYPKAMALCRDFYPVVSEALTTISRPVMLVDVLRWVVVHRYGGVYWQMNSCPLVGMEKMLPSPGHHVRLFTEFDQTIEHGESMRSEPIRAGEPEERKRVLIQVFSAAPGSAFISHIIDFLVGRVRAYKPKKDYDILFITGNAAASTAYDQFGKNDPDVELVPLDETKKMIKVWYKGTWRTDSDSTKVAGQSQHRASNRRGLLKDLAAQLVYNSFKTHPHEEVLTSLASRYSNYLLLHSIVSTHNIKSVCEIMCGEVKPEQGTKDVAYIGVDLDRNVVRKNCASRIPNARFVRCNPLYSTPPKAGILLCADYLERISYCEMQQILKKITRAAVRYIALTDHPLLRENWDTALGDYRPVNFMQPPFSFPEPDFRIATEPSGGRTDRVVSIWRMETIKDLLK